ncbi:hypothetical protein C8R47DRAFT_1213567 [Mycena vitilis]|nr:hypothetical protein C8R47DRAFT_1213567 [Mycena vitilis]
MSCVYGIWTAKGVWHAYPDITEDGIAITTPWKFPLQESASTIRRAWKALHKYMARGMTIALNELPMQHVCGVDLNCPTTLRLVGDKGCSFNAFPDWPYNADVEEVPLTCWTLGGTGCAQGILATGRGTPIVATANRHSEWNLLMKLYIRSSTWP